MPASYRFGAFVVDTERYRLLRDGQPLALSPKALDLLILFAGRPEALVTKDEMLKALWPDVAVTDNALTQVVSELRQALGDQPSSPKFIETVPRRGYRFVADVTTTSSGAAPVEPEHGTMGQLFAGLPPPRVAMVSGAPVYVRETASVEAYRAFTEGRLKLEALDAEQIGPAIADFERALALDARYALAHVGLAHAHFWTFQASRARNLPDVSALTKAVAHARRAIELDADLAEAHSALALFLIAADRPVEAVAAGRRALALEPGVWRHQFRLGVAAWGSERLECLEAVLMQFPQMAYAYFGVAMVHVARQDLTRAQGVLDRGLAFEADAALRLERFPGKGLHWLSGLVKAALGDTRAAHDEFDRELSSQARALFAEEFAMDAFDGHGFAFLMEDDGASAVAMFERALERYPDHARSLVGRAEAHRRIGRRAAMEQDLGRADRAILDLNAHGRHAEAALASAFRHVVRAEPDAAVTALDALLTRTPPGFAGWTIPVEPLLQPLKSSPGFAAVLRRLADRAA